MNSAEWNVGTAAVLWRKSGEADSELAAEPGPAESLWDLTSSQYYGSCSTLRSMSILNGILAVHQAGALAALVHPFCDKAQAESQAVFWEGHDKHTPARQRPFAPRMMADTPFVLFSSPSAVSRVNVWSLPGWGPEQQPRFEQVCHVRVGSDTLLAGPPVSLDEKRLGILTVTGARNSTPVFRWVVIDLPRASPLVLDAAEGQVLPIKGRACQITAVPRRVIAFATAHGHWMWRWHDAENSRVGEVKSTLQAPDSNFAPAIDREIEDPNWFHFPRQHIDQGKNDDHLAPEHESNLGWYFCSAQQQLFWYDMDVANLGPKRPFNLSQNDRQQVVPLGHHRDELTGVNSVIVVQGRTLCRSVVGGKITSFSGVGILDEIEQCSGLIFESPLLLMIGESLGSNRRKLTVRSLSQARGSGEKSQTIVLGPLRADPVRWGRWLFTIESESIDGREAVCVVRRALNEFGTS